MAVKLIEKNRLNEKDLNLLTELFKMLGYPTRVKILLLLHQHEICVGGLAKQLNVSGSAVSHQLRLLKSNRLVKMRREGREIIYSLADGHIHTIIEKGLEHILE